MGELTILRNQNDHHNLKACTTELKNMCSLHTFLLLCLVYIVKFENSSNFCVMLIFEV